MSLESLNAKFGKKSSGSAAKKIAEHTKTHGTSSRARVHEIPPGYGGKVKIPARLKSLLDELNDDDIDRVAVVYRECMTATFKVWIDEGKHKNGRAKGHWEVSPDYKTRLAAANMVAAYKEGLPVQRQITLAGKFKDLSEMMGQLQDSPQGKQLLAELPAIDVESSVVRENRTTESSVQETGGQTGDDSPSETASQSEQS